MERPTFTFFGWISVLAGGALFLFFVVILVWGLYNGISQGF